MVYVIRVAILHLENVDFIKNKWIKLEKLKKIYNCVTLTMSLNLLKKKLKHGITEDVCLLVFSGWCVITGERGAL